MPAPKDTALSIGLLALRLGAGGLLLLGHGWPKLMQWEQKSLTFADPLGVGPAVSLGLVIFAEVACALLVMIGFATRWALVPILVFFAVAIFMQHAGQPFAERELAMIYAVPFVALMFTGPGRFALDGHYGPKLRFGK